MKPGAASRAAAARVVHAVMRGRTLEQALAQNDIELPERDLPLLRELSYGSLRLFPRLDAVLAQLLNRPLRARDGELRALALVGLYQLDALRIPPHAAVSATVDAAVVLGRRPATGLLNAVLRRFQRERDALFAALPADAASALPTWLWDAIGAQWPESRDGIAASAARHPPMTLRVNIRRTSRDSYLERLREAGISAAAGSLGAQSVVLSQGLDVTALPGFVDGDVSVQDEAAQLAAALLDPQPGEKLLDGCAAPGGKTGHLLERLGGRGCVVACDASEERLARVRDNLGRLGLEAQLVCADLREPPESLREKGLFDGILLDVPCSATGVIRRHPDIKLLRRAEDIAGFARQQRELLDGVWPLLRPGGRLLYITCSILRQENSDLVTAFLADTDDALEQPLSLPTAAPCNVGRQLLPSPDGPDGLYFALLRKAA